MKKRGDDRAMSEILRSNGLICYHSKLMEYSSNEEFYTQHVDFDGILRICETLETKSSLKRRKLERALLRLRYANERTKSNVSFILLIMSILVLCVSCLVIVASKKSTSKSRWKYHSLPYLFRSPEEESPTSHANFTYMDEMRDRKYVVICAGSRRSGSTWQYHTARMIMKLADPSRRLVEAAKSSERVKEITSILSSTPQSIYGKDLQPYTILKLHEYREEWANLATHVFTSHRDPRDVYFSVKRMKMEWEVTKSKGGMEYVSQLCGQDSRLTSDVSLCAMAVFRENYLNWLSSSSSSSALLHDMHYESVFDDTEESILDEIRTMIRVLGFENHVSAHAVRFAVEQFSRHRAGTLRAAGNTGDDTRYKLDREWDVPKKEDGDESDDPGYSYMHIRHIENPLHGQSRKYLSPEQVEAVEDVFQDWIRDGGY